jgi:Domain of unknown function (DUF4328)
MTGRAFRVLVLLSGAAIVLQLIAILIQIQGLMIARDFAAGAAAWDSEIDGLIRLENRLAAVWLVVALAYLGALAAFTARANVALREAGVPNLRYSPGASAWLFFVPLWNLYHGLVAPQELYRATQHDPRTADLTDWDEQKNSPRLTLGWLLGVVAVLISIATQQFIGEAPDADLLVTAFLVFIAASVMAILSTVLYVRGFAQITRGIEALTAAPQPEEPMSKIRFQFRPRWKEELVCSTVLGNLVLDMPMGVTSVYLPTEASWARQAPEWARGLWFDLHADLVQWCASERVPLYVEDSATVYEEDPRLRR